MSDRSMATLMDIPMGDWDGPAGPRVTRLPDSARRDFDDADFSFRFDPSQPRDSEGQWTDEAGGWSISKPDGPITVPGSAKPAVEDRKAFESVDERDQVAKRIADPEKAARLGMAIDFYGGPGFKHMNTSLRGGSGLYDGEKNFVRALDAGIAASPLPEDAVLWRGASGDRMFGPEWLAGSLVGAEWTDASFTSTSANEKVGTAFALDQEIHPHPVVMRVVARKGTGALRVGKWGSGGVGREAELVLGRDSRFRVLADHGTNKKGVRRIDVEVISSNPREV